MLIIITIYLLVSKHSAKAGINIIAFLKLSYPYFIEEETELENNNFSRAHR